MNFRNVNVLVVGDIMLDQFWIGTCNRISPEAPIPVVLHKETSSKPGGAGNVAMNIAKLGAKVKIIGCVGEDEASKELIKLFDENNIDSVLISSPKAVTTRKLRILASNHHLLRVDNESEIPDECIENLFQVFKESINGINIIIFSDYAKGTLKNIEQLIKYAKDNNIIVIVDPKGSSFVKYSNVDIITPNFSEFQNIVGFCKTEDEILQKGYSLLKELKLKNLLITRSEHGMTLIDSCGKNKNFPALAQEVCDVTGAGDTVIATLAVAIGSGLPIEDAINLSNIAAGIVVSKIGTATVTYEELQKNYTNKFEIL
jgi:D-beta-D-heptose 7-phosphate kinase/D-beta-D-heptose 1-phosphate adenosyltransferase